MGDNKQTYSEDVPSHASDSSREDAVYVKKARTGDEKAYRYLVDKYKRALYFHIRKMVKDDEVIEDLVQEVFSKAFNSLHSYSDTYAFSTWLYRIASNHSIDYLRKKKLKTYSINEPITTKSGEMEYSLPDETYAADRLILRKQRRNIVREAMNQLPDKYRRVIELRHMEEKSYQEIAEILNEPLGTVKAHIFRARELLYKSLKDLQGTF